jgi:IS605 OrfB family transposase
MKKAHRHSKATMMRRSSRIYLGDLNKTKAATIVEFLHLCHDATQYFVDLFWQRKDFGSHLADLATVHRGRDRFSLTTRLSQALAKQAKESIRSVIERGDNRKPRLRRHTVTLYYHFVKIERFNGSFDFAVKLIGSGAPRTLIPVKTTSHLNRLLASGWTMAKSIRIGRDRKHRLWIDLILEKPRPARKESGAAIGMDSNYKAGLVFSDEQVIAGDVYHRIQMFAKRQKHTKAEVKSLIGHALKSLDLSKVKTLCIEDLKYVKHNTRGKFPRRLNRRMSHWLYAYTISLLERACEESGIRLERKNPWKTSQFCRHCRKWDRRNRVGDKFLCVNCGHSENADFNAAKNLELLGEAGAYGLRLLQV